MPEVRVLHVDDDDSLLGLASAMLERRGFDVVTVTDVDRALEVLDSEPVDCVVSDYQMPERNGLEFLELVRERDPALPFVLFTGKGSEEVASDAIAAGVTDYLQKRTDPEQFEELADRVERAVRERRTAEGLSEGDRILTALVETLSGVVYRLRLPGEEPTFLGGRVEGLTGYDAAAFRNGEVTWYAVIHEDDRDRVEREVETALAEGRSFDVTYRIRTESGRVRRVSNRGRGVYDGDGEPVAVEGFVLDRSDGAHEARVRELHAATRRLFAADSAEEVARLTAAAARDVLGYPVNCVRLYDPERGVLRPAASNDGSEGLVGERPTYPVPDDANADPMEAGNYPATAFRAGKPVVVDEFGEEDSPAGSGPVESAMYLALGEYGTISIGATEPSSFDATARELAGILAENAAVALERAFRERALEAERDRLAALFENIPDPAVRVEVVDGEPVVEAVNPAFESTFGDDGSAVVGRSLDDVIVPPGDRGDARTYDEHIRAGESLHAEVRRETADGVRDFLLHLVPRAREGATGGYAIYTDITERRERERELARQNERLEEFASVVSHDLRNPLNVAEGQLEIARATGANEAFDAVERAHERMESRIEGLLDLARQGRAAGETAPVDLAGLSRTAWESVGTGDARLELADGLPTVEADRERLRQLFENLFSNAVSHGTGGSTPRPAERAAEPHTTDGGSGGAAEGDGTRDRHEVADGETVEAGGAGPSLSVTVGPLVGGFYVADDGVGLPDGVRERVFEPGYSTGDDGTGFGLAIVRSIAEAHGWSVAATEGPDGGACFEFTGVEVLDDGFPDADPNARNGDSTGDAG